jgi:hypothetical protein
MEGFRVPAVSRSVRCRPLRSREFTSMPGASKVSGSAITLRSACSIVRAVARRYTDVQSAVS